MTQKRHEHVRPSVLLVKHVDPRAAVCISLVENNRITARAPKLPGGSATGDAKMTNLSPGKVRLVLPNATKCELLHVIKNLVLGG